MQAKYLIVIVITSAIIVGLFFFQKDRQNKELMAHNKQQILQVTKIAKKSHSAGMLVMASAINKFHREKGHYPSSLLKLYPEFILERTFISEPKWDYRPQKNTYLLEKSVEGGKTIASMGPDLRMETRRTLSSTPQKMVASVKKEKPIQKPEEKTVTQKLLKIELATKKNLEKNYLVKASSQDQKINSRNLNSTKKKKTVKSEPEITIVKKELNKDEKFLISFDNAGFYIWKTKDGVIGFSNIQYPEEKKLTIYRGQNWIEYVGR